MRYLVYTGGVIVAWGLWAFLPKLATSRLDYKTAIVWEWLGMVVLVVPCLIMLGGRIDTGKGAFGYAVVAGICGLSGGLLYYKAMSVCGEHAATVATLSAVYPVVSILLAVLILHEKLNMGQVAGMILCLAGALLLAFCSRAAG